MPSNLLLVLALLGGYWFLHSFSYTRVRSQALDGYRLLLESVAVGITFCAISYLIVSVLDYFQPEVRLRWHEIAPQFPYLATVGGGALLGMFSAYLLNWTLKLAGLSETRLRRRAIIRHGNEIQRLLQEASINERLISITLDTRKVYVGFVRSVTSLAPTATHFSIAPMLSGYREADTLNLVFTVDYLDGYQKGADPDMFRVVIAFGHVKMAAFFDPSLYPLFVLEEEPKAGETPAQSDPSPNPK